VISARSMVMEHSNEIIKPEASKADLAPRVVDDCENWWTDDRSDLKPKFKGSFDGTSETRTLTMLEAVKDVEGFYNKHFGKINISNQRNLRKHGIALNVCNVLELNLK
jgi:hypothetical protein